MKPVRSALPAVALLLVVTGCSLFESASDMVAPASAMTEPELRDRIESFSDRFARSIQGASDSIGLASADTATRKAVLHWKMNVIGEMREAAGRSDARAALSDCWTLCVQVRRHFDGPPADATTHWTVAPDARAVILQAMRDLEEDVREIGLEWLGQRRFDQASAEIEEFAATHPIQGRFGRRTYDRPALAGKEFPRVEAIVSATLSPFNFVGGIDRTAQAIHEFSTVADQFTSVVEALPEQTRWEAQLALYDFEERETVVGLRRDVASLAKSTDEFVDVARALPAAFEGALVSSIERTDGPSQRLLATAESVERTVQSASGLTAEVDSALERTGGVLAAAESATDGLARAGTAWEGVFRAIDDLAADDGGAPSPSETGEEDSFDVTEYGDAADRVGAAAVELRAGIAELRALLDGADVERVAGAVDASTEAALRRTSDHAVDLVDHAAKRAAQLAGLVFGLALVFVLVTRRWK